MEFYVTQNCLRDLNVKDLLFEPYCVGLKNLKRAFFDNYFINESYDVKSPSLISRVKHFALGLVLFIPFVNSLALAILRSYDLKLIQQLQAPKIKAAIQIQSAFRGFRAKKAYQQKREAAIKIQAAFRGWKCRKAYQELQKSMLIDKPKQQKLGWWQKAQKLFWGQQMQSLIKKQTRVDVGQAVLGAIYLKESMKALYHRQLRLSAYYASWAVMGAFNATYRLLTPAGVSELERAQQYALGGVSS